MDDLEGDKRVYLLLNLWGPPTNLMSGVCCNNLANDLILVVSSEKAGTICFRDPGVWMRSRLLYAHRWVDTLGACVGSCTTLQHSFGA